jgi:hypothetical protein
MNKLKVFILSVLAVIFGSCSNAQDNKKNVSNSNSENMEGKKVLVAYFSWSGNTKSVAEYIAAKLTADKELFIVPGATHIRTYFVEEYVNQISAKIQKFFTEKL